MKRIEELKTRLAAIEAEINAITDAFGSEYVDPLLIRDRKQLQSEIDDLGKVEILVKAAEERTVQILKAAGLVASEDGCWQHPHHQEKGVYVNKNVDENGIPGEIDIWDDGLGWRYTTHNNGAQSRISVYVQLPTASGEDRQISKTIFTISWPASQYPSAEVNTRNDELQYVLQKLELLPVEIRNFRKAELKCSYDSLKRMIAAAGVKTPDIAVQGAIHHAV